MSRLLHVLAPLRAPSALPDLSGMNLTDKRKMGKFWRVSDASKLPREQLDEAIKHAWRTEGMARAVVSALRPEQRAVVEVFARYNGLAQGAVLRLDLTARGVMRVVTHSTRPDFHWTKWAANPVQDLLQ